jgi:branched-subunit amino acid permease
MSGLSKERQTFASSIDTLGGLVGTTSELLKEIRPSVKYDVTAALTTPASSPRTVAG